MRITIDNLDGHGAIDYSMAVCTDGPVTVRRMLNAPSRCTAELLLGTEGFPTPGRKGRVVVSSEDGDLLFTGFLIVEPALLFLGTGSTGPAYKVRINAVSDEWLLDKQGVSPNTASYGLFVGANSASVAEQLTQGTASTGLSVVQSGNPRAIGSFAVTPGAGWSTNAAAAANASYSVYRVLGGTMTLADAGTTTHTLGDGDGAFSIGDLRLGQLRELANDVTISGAEEASTYVQEMFLGDGTTTVFSLSEAVFRGLNRTLVLDRFDETSLDTTQWLLSDGGNHIQLSGAGLSVSGGTGMDGQTTLIARNQVELGGALVAELGAVVLGAASDGMLAGFYDGPPTLESCFAGFRVRQSGSSTGGVTQLVPVLQGVEVGSPFTPQSGHRYTLRLRLYSFEMQRVPQRYYCMVDGVVQSFGDVAGVSAPAHLVFELLDEGMSSNTPATVLYDSVSSGSPVGASPAICSFVAVNSTSLQVSLGAASVTRTGSLWLTSTLPNGTQASRLVGLAGEGVDCLVDFGNTTGTPAKLTFLAGRVPQAGERITAYYRRVRRAVARLADQASVTAETAAGTGVSVPGVSRWLGSVSSPAARSSADCEAAAQAVLAMSTARSAAFSGTCVVSNPAQDIWPGDLLQVQQNGTTLSVLVRSVELEDGHAEPELVCYKLSFANDWATEWEDGLGLKLNSGCAHDALLPVTAMAAPAAVLANLQQMTVLSLTGAAIQIDAGCDAPPGGGFEVRRRPEEFGVNADVGDLVLRSPVRSFSIPRSAQVERFFVRMYDGSTTPLYSRFSNAVYIHWPLDTV